MADEEEKVEPTEGEESEENSGGKKKKLIIIGAIALVVILGGAGAAFFLLSGGEEPKAESSETADEASEGEKPDESAAADGEKKPEGDKDGKDKEKGNDEDGKDAASFGSTYTFKTFHLNLGNPLENHYVRLEVAVEYKGGEEQKKELEQRTPQLRDAIVSVASRKSREFLLGPDGKDQLRREVLIRVNRYMNKPVEAVFITDILIE